MRGARRRGALADRRPAAGRADDRRADRALGRAGAAARALRGAPGVPRAVARATARSRTCSAACRRRSRPTRCSPSAGTPTCAWSTTASSTAARRRSPTLPHVRGYHLVPERASKAAAVALPPSRVRGYAREETFAVGRLARGPRLRRGGRDASGWSPTRVARDPSMREAIAGLGERARRRGGHTARASTRRSSRADGALAEAARSGGWPPASAPPQAPPEARPRPPPPERGRRHRRAHQRDPVVERQLAGDQAAERAGHRGARRPRARARGRAAAPTPAPRPPGRRARGSRRRGRPPRAARRRGGCGSRGASAVATRSPVPARPIIDSGRAPRLSA